MFPFHPAFSPFGSNHLARRFAKSVCRVRRSKRKRSPPQCGRSPSHHLPARAFHRASRFLPDDVRETRTPRGQRVAHFGPGRTPQGDGFVSLASILGACRSSGGDERDPRLDRGNPSRCQYHRDRHGGRLQSGGPWQFAEVTAALKQITELLGTTTEAAREIELSTRLIQAPANA
jgi:hypothetical protein